LKEGTPREVQTNLQADSTTIAGVKKFKQNVRYAVIFLGIFFSGFAIAIYFTDISPVTRARINYPVGFLLILIGALSWVAFGLDVNSERHVVACRSLPNQTRVCDSREDLGTGASVFDAFSAVFLIVSGVLVIAYTYTGDWMPERAQLVEDEMYGYTYQPGLQSNGISSVRRSITMLALVCALIFCIILVIFTVLINQQKEGYQFMDANNRAVQSGSLTISGWPLNNTKLRYAATSFTIITILFNMIPLTSRVIAYILGFLYICYSAITFASFGLDVNAIEEAKGLVCPTGFNCYYDAFNATIVLNFMGGFMLLVYVIYEYFISKRNKTPEAVIVA